MRGAADDGVPDVPAHVFEEAEEAAGHAVLGSRAGTSGQSRRNRRHRGLSARLAPARDAGRVPDSGLQAAGAGGWT